MAEQTQASSTSSTRDDLDRALVAFTNVRTRLFGIAYRMLGSVADAEDIVQDAWLRWQSCDRARVREPAAFLATTTTRLAMNALQSARARHETYAGPWLPEPIDTGTGPELAAEHAETLRLGVLILLERLTPTERAAFVLREAFGYPYHQIALITHASDAGARQLVSRARKHLSRERRSQAAPAQPRTFMHAFLLAAHAGDLKSFESLLAASCAED